MANWQKTTRTVQFGAGRAPYLTDVARTHAGVGDTDTAITAVLQAETIAADEVCTHQITRALIPNFSLTGAASL